MRTPRKRNELTGRYYPDRRRVTALRIAADNDRNGNRRRCWIVFDGDGNTIAAVDEGYEGTAALRRHYPNARELGRRIPTTATYYRKMLRDFGA